MPVHRLFPADRVRQMREHIRTFAAGFGIPDMKSPERLPNTRRALAIAEYARDRGKLDAFRTAVMEAHWKEGQDIEDNLVLHDLAKATDLDPEEALRAADAAEYLRRTDEVRAEAGSMGIGGVPTFIIGDQRVEGCQSYEVLSDMMLRAGGRPREKA